MKETEAETLRRAVQWKQNGHNAALACVVKCWGSAPCPPGSHLAIRDDGLFAGSVSGGCIEADVITRAQDAMLNQTNEYIEYGVSDAKAWEVGLACGGRIAVSIQPLLKTSLIQQALDDRDAKKSVLIATDLIRHQQRLFYQQKDEKNDPLSRAAASALAEGKPQLHEWSRERWFLQPLMPPLRLVIVGAAHIASSLSQIAALAGYEIIIIDPREAFANSQRFKQEKIINAWPDEAIPNLNLDRKTALVVLSHDPKIDDPALLAALQSPCFYIGALGSKKTHAARLERLKNAAAKQDDLKRIRGPVGLPIGASGPAEIAISILAQITQDLHK